MAGLICPSCAVPLVDPTLVQQLTICPSCLRSIVIEGESEQAGRLATASDTLALRPNHIAALKTQRKQARQVQA